MPAHKVRMPKWIGFDLDECIGSVMPLYAFVRAASKHANRDTVLNDLKNDLYFSESMKTTWLVRPVIYEALMTVYKAYKSGKIAGAFIFSNNGCPELVEFMAFYCNEYMRRKSADYRLSPVFQMAAYRGSPLRSPGSLVKSFSEIQTALRLQGLTPMTSIQDLLFFDDMDHVLAGEIPGYIRVRPYMNICPVEPLIAALESTRPHFSPEEWNAICNSARKYAFSDRYEGYLSIPPTVKDMLYDRGVFLSALQRFLGSRGGGGGGTRHMKRRSRKKTRRIK